jgi:hypothetical protein
MALTVSQIISDVKYLTDETVIPSTTDALRLVNLARREIAKKALCLEAQKTFTTTAETYDLTVPSDVYKIFKLTNYVGDDPHEVLPLTKTEFDRLDKSTTGSNIDWYYQNGSTMWLYPRGVVAPTTSLGDNLTSSTSSLVMSVGTSFPTVGTVMIGSEKIIYNGKTDSGTSVVAGYLTRGAEGTTASVHTSGDVITFQNITMDYYKLPTDLTTTSSNVESIFETYENIIPYYVAYKMKLKDTDDVQSSGSAQQSKYFFDLYLGELENLTQDMKTSNDTTYTVREINP